MPVDLESLPHDPIALREMVTNREIENDGLRAEIDKLHLMIKGLQRHRFGRRSEQIDPEQMQRKRQLANALLHAANLAVC